jgi:hypothetical protein
MKQKDRRELRSTIAKKSSILENPEEVANPIIIEHATTTPNKTSGHVD